VSFGYDSDMSAPIAAHTDDEAAVHGHGEVVGRLAPPSDDDGYAYSIDEVAGRLGVHRTTIYDMLHRGELESVKIGARRVIPRGSLLAFLRCETPSHPAAS
jgi:excisionase family DNA binding protein